MSSFQTDITEIVPRLRELVKAVINADWTEFVMRFPAELNHDADIVLTSAADHIVALQARLELSRKRAAEWEDKCVKLQARLDARSDASADYVKTLETETRIMNLARERIDLLLAKVDELTGYPKRENGCDIQALAKAVYDEQCAFVDADHERHCVDMLTVVFASFEDGIEALQARLDAVEKCNKPGYADLCVKAVALIELFHAVRKQEQGS